MDTPYDHIQEEILSAHDPSEKEEHQNTTSSDQRPNVDLNAELQETILAFSASPWGARIGGLWGSVLKQGESYYEGARQEYAAASEEAAKGLSGLRSTIVEQTRNLTLNTGLAVSEPVVKHGDDGETTILTSENEEDRATEDAAGESFLARIKVEAAKRLKELERAEDAADEALLRFGMSVRQRLRDAVSIVPPDQHESPDTIASVSKDTEGRRIIHATRFEAQLHVIHSNLEKFSQDPTSEQWMPFKKEFSVDAKTNTIAEDLNSYPELRSAMENLVPERVEYKDFWSRYYFLRLAVEAEEQKRKELVKDVNTDGDEQIAWDDDSDSNSDAGHKSDSPSTPHAKYSEQSNLSTIGSNKGGASENTNLKPRNSRRSNDQQSQPDSESSYDVVSGTTSHNPASPKEKILVEAGESDEEDWE